MELMTIKETAAFLKVSPVTVRRFIARRRLSALHVGRAIRLSREEVERLPTPVADAPEPATQRNRRGGRPTSESDPLWNIVGIGSSEGPTDVSSNKKKYLAEIYLAEGE
jgi:excisionase family DNA binding protein